MDAYLLGYGWREWEEKLKKRLKGVEWGVGKDRKGKMELWRGRKRERHGKMELWGGKKCEKHFCLFLLLFKKWVGIAKVVVRIAILVHKILNTNLGRSSICTLLHYFGGPRHTWYTIHHFFQSSNQSRCKVLLYTLMYYNFSHLHLLFNHLPLLQPPWCLCHSLSYTPIGGNYRWRRSIFSL